MIRFLNMTDGAERSLSDVLRRIGLKQRFQADAAVSSAGLTAMEGRTIGYIEFAEADGGLIQRQIAERAGITAASASSLLQDLEQRGYIERRTDPADVRRKTLHTTAKGRAVVEDFHSVMAEYDRQLVAPLSPDELTTLFELLDRIDAGLD